MLMQFIYFRKYQLPDCSISLKLFNENHPKHLISSVVQVFGEVRLYNKIKIADNITYDDLESSYTLIHRINELKKLLSEKEIEEEIERIRQIYLPIIQVYSIKRLQDAKEIIVENLNFRLLQKRRDQMLLAKKII